MEIHQKEVNTRFKIYLEFMVATHVYYFVSSENLAIFFL